MNGRKRKTVCGRKRLVIKGSQKAKRQRTDKRRSFVGEKEKSTGKERIKL